MRLVTFEAAASGSAPRIGVEVDAGVVDLVAFDAAAPASMRAFLEGGQAALDLAAKAVAAGTHVIASGEYKLLAPITNPDKIICVGMNYVDHCTEQNMPVPTEPVIFSKFGSCIVGNGDPIILPPETKKLDFEVELAIVIGKTAKRVKADDAMDYVAGYTVAHDVSARDWQLERNGGQWLLGKTFDTFAPIGPAIVTKDAISDPHKLGIRCRLNGETVQDSNTEQLVFKTGAIIEWLTQFVTLCPGDLIFTGTPPGVGCFRKPPVWLKDGDVVEVEIDELGMISNPVVAEGADEAAVKRARHK
eukprot:m.300514 g.300514  ORF g.300514 m.300514 type:complete len:303 (-) comp14477_c0_seq1:36-944(-)